jgi:hypothetical protein
MPKILANVCLWCIYWHYCGRVASTADVPKPQFSPLNQWSPCRIRLMAGYGMWWRPIGDQVSASSRRTILAPSTMAHIFP